MAKYLIAALCVMLAVPAFAEDDDNLSAIEQVRKLSEEQDKAEQKKKAGEQTPTASEQGDAATNGEVKAADIPSASGVPESTPPSADGGSTMAPKSSIPPEQRKGGDITQCLDADGKTGTEQKDKAVAACAEPYSPRHKSGKK